MQVSKSSSVSFAQNIAPGTQSSFCWTQVSKSSSVSFAQNIAEGSHCARLELLLDLSLKKFKRLICPRHCSGNSGQLLLNQFSRLTSKHSMATRQLTQYKAS
mmetsp:Transcript_86762/g.158429  ORF Transcript_86762/g.158429 Transcript_86762/m.158429 type:complete len:102 (-) Transcript_86762:166-471(-)